MIHLPICFLLLTASAVLFAAPASKLGPGPGPGPHGHPPFPPGPPPDFKNVLPPAVWDQLTAIHQDSSLSVPQKMNKIDAIMDALPDSIREKLPLPPPFRKLPENIQQQLKAVHMQRGLPREQRFQKIHAIIESLPPDLKKLVPPPPHHGPPPQ